MATKGKNYYDSNEPRIVNTGILGSIDMDKVPSGYVDEINDILGDMLQLNPALLCQVLADQLMTLTYQRLIDFMDELKSKFAEGRS